MAALLGQPFMPWQRLVADVGTEYDATTGVPCYREVIVTVPRQSGKTVLDLSWEIQRAIGWDGPQRIAYSAQSGSDARKKLIEDQVPLLERHKATLGITRILRAMGNEQIEFNNGSRIILLASSLDSGHGKTIDLGVRDELFADTDNRRDQAMVPAMATKPAAQILTTSTMGTDESIPLNDAVERGRAAVEADLREGVAYFEWSAGEDDDPDDPVTWWKCMPALGHTITEAVVRHARMTLPDGEFRRAFLNLKTRADDRVIPVKDWYAICSPEAKPTAPLCFALDVNVDRVYGSIVAASAAPGGVPTAELVERQQGTGWLVGRAVELSEKWGRTRWTIDAAGPAASLLPDMIAAGLDVHAVTAKELIQACGQLYDGVMEHKIALRRHPALDEAAAAAAKRQVLDAWAWTRKSASADISPLLAVTLALWSAVNHVTVETALWVPGDDDDDDDEE